MSSRLLVALVALLAGCSGKRDLDTLCRIADEVERDASVAAEQKMLVVMQRFEASDPGEDMRNVSTAMASVEPGKRWDVLVHGAEEVGAPNWQCEPMKRLLKPTAPVPAPAPE